MATPTDILNNAFQRATVGFTEPLVTDKEILSRVDFVCRNIQNRAGIRFLLACLLAKVHRPEVDIRKPYTEIGGPDSYSGRTYDELYISPFIIQQELPCNPTTAFLTPALRNRNIVLTPEVNLVGRPPKLYQTVLQLLTDVYEKKVSPEDLLVEAIRNLVILREEKRQWMKTVLSGLKMIDEATPLATETIVTLVEQHLKSKGSSRLPVLVVVAIYKVVEQFLGERVLPPNLHNAADKQTGALGDLEITFVNNDNIITSYEMKMRRVTREDIDNALQKISGHIGQRPDNYIFITTDVIEQQVSEYAASIYDRTGGLEVSVLNCKDFLRYFLHLFYRFRMQFLETYQELVLLEPESAVSQPLKEVFLALRQAAESSE